MVGASPAAIKSRVQRLQASQKRNAGGDRACLWKSGARDRDARGAGVCWSATVD